jgi:hypothetical protein
MVFENRTIYVWMYHFGAAQGGGAAGVATIFKKMNGCAAFLQEAGGNLGRPQQ